MNPYQSAPKNKKKMTLIGIYIALVASIMSSAGLSTLLPAAALDIGGTEIYPLASNISSVLGICLMPLFGYWGMKNPAGKTKLFAVSMLLSTAVVFLRGISPNMWFFTVANAFWGICTAAIYVVGYSVIRDMFDAKQAGVYLGVSGTMTSIGMLIGPALTGLIIDNISWRLVCHIIWPILLLSGILVHFGVRVTKSDFPDTAQSGRKFDYSGAFALMVFLASLILVLSLGSNFIPFGSLFSNVLVVVGILALIMLVLVIRKKQITAIIPAPVLRDRNVICLTLCNLILNFSTMALFFFMPTYVLYVMNGTATQASLTTTLFSVLGLVLSPIFGKAIAAARSAKNVLVGGTIIRIAVTLALLFLLTPNTSLWVVYTLILVAGIYSSQQSVTFAAAPQIQVKPELRMMGNSVIQIGQSLGSSIGLAVYTLVIGMSGVAEGMKTALILAIASAVVALVVSLMLKKLDAPEKSAT